MHSLRDAGGTLPRSKFPLQPINAEQGLLHPRPPVPLERHMTGALGCRAKNRVRSASLSSVAGRFPAAGNGPTIPLTHVSFHLSPGRPWAVTLNSSSRIQAGFLSFLLLPPLRSICTSGEPRCAWNTHGPRPFLYDAGERCSQRPLFFFVVLLFVGDVRPRSLPIPPAFTDPLHCSLLRLSLSFSFIDYFPIFSRGRLGKGQRHSAGDWRKQHTNLQKNIGCDIEYAANQQVHSRTQQARRKEQ